jgi:hypothetical protein
MEERLNLVFAEKFPGQAEAVHRSRHPAVDGGLQQHFHNFLFGAAVV